MSPWPAFLTRGTVSRSSSLRGSSPVSCSWHSLWRKNHRHDKTGIDEMAKHLKIDSPEVVQHVLEQVVKGTQGKLGFGINGSNLTTNPCANWDLTKGFACANEGLFPCPSCGLVSYCSPECKNEHLNMHKKCCDTVVNRSRVPENKVLRGSERFQNALERSTPVWGNVPSYGLLGRHAHMETPATLPKNLKLCFAASGDLRNVIETICQIPRGFSGDITMYINDHDPMIVARNFLILNLLRTCGYDAIDVVIALWYSTSMTYCQNVLVDVSTIATLNRAYKYNNKEERFQLNFGSFSTGSVLSVEDGGEIWPFLVCMCENKCSLQSILTSRMEIIQKGPKFYANLACLLPSHQVVWEEFRRSGMILPFGSYYHTGEWTLNKFIVHPSEGWIISPDANPLIGWNMMNVMSTGSVYRVPKYDMFGSLFFHLRDQLGKFVEKLKECKVCFNLSCKSASHLASHLKHSGTRLHRVDTSNIADPEYCGLKQVLNDWGPLLERVPGFNSTLITYFMNWAFSQSKSTPDRIMTLSKLTCSDVAAAVKLIMERDVMGSGEFLRLLSIGNSNGKLSILDYFHDSTSSFESFLESINADVDAEAVGLTRQKKNNIVPHRLSVGIEDCNGVPGKTASYDQCYYDCMVGDMSLTERFVEWGLER